MVEQSERLKLEEKEDRISDLPDSLLHHILSFLPSTEDAVRTGILSKRWQNQWARVPVLIFQHYASWSDDYYEEFVRFIENILLQHDCSKIQKLHLAYNFTEDSNFSEKISFASRKHVEELIFQNFNPNMFSKLPFENSQSINWGSLKVLKLAGTACDMLGANFLSASPLLELLDLNPKGGYGYVIASESLKTLILSEIHVGDDGDIEISCPNLEQLSFNRSSFLDNKMIENVVSSCPLLHKLELDYCGFDEKPVIASKSLKTLIIVELCVYYDEDDDIEISCPNLEQLSFKSSTSPEKMIENVVSSCSLLHKLELDHCDLEKLVIASKSLRTLVLRDLKGCALEISCPNLEELDFYSGAYSGTFYTDIFKLMNTRPLICPTLDFEIPQYAGYHDKTKQIIEKLQNVKEITIGSRIIKSLSDAGLGDLSYLWVNYKTLTLNGPNFKHLPQILCALRSSPILERLVIKLQQVYEHQMTEDLMDFDDSREIYWNSNGTDVNCLSRLKTIEIIGLSKQDAKLKSVFNFIEFLFKNARELEKLVLVISKDCGKDFASTVSQKVSSFPRCSRHAIVKLLCSNE